MIDAVYIGCADDRRRIIRVNSNDALRSSAHPMISEPYRVTLAHLTGWTLTQYPSHTSIVPFTIIKRIKIKSECKPKFTLRHSLLTIT